MTTLSHDELAAVTGGTYPADGSSPPAMELGPILPEPDGFQPPRSGSHNNWFHNLTKR